MTDGQWHKVEPYLDSDRKRKYDIRDIVDGIFWLARTGAKWRNLDSQFPPDRTVINHFAKLSRKGSLKRIKEVLNRMERCEVRVVRSRRACYYLRVDGYLVPANELLGDFHGIEAVLVSVGAVGELAVEIVLGELTLE